MGKRLGKAQPICFCASPRPSYRNPRAIFSWYEEDVWTEIAKLLDGRSLVMFAVTCKWFHRIMMEDSVWRYACLRDLQVPDPGNVPFKWIKLYAAAFDGSHTYIFRQQEKDIDWMRIGAFLFDSHDALLTENLIENIKVLKAETAEKLLPQEGYCLLNNTKTGIWIADLQLEDLQLVRCPVCDLDTCDGNLTSLIVPAAVDGAVGYGYMWWKEVLKDVMQFLILRGHNLLIPDLFNLYRDVKVPNNDVGNGINWGSRATADAKFRLMMRNISRFDSSDSEPDEPDIRIDLKQPFFEGVEYCWGDKFLITPFNQGETTTIVSILYSDMAIHRRADAVIGSVQELLDWFPKLTGRDLIADRRGIGCSFQELFLYVQQVGLLPEIEYKWDGVRRIKPKVDIFVTGKQKIYIRDFKYIDNGKHEDVIKMLRKQPIAGLIFAAPSFHMWNHKVNIYPGASAEEVEKLRLEGKDAGCVHAITLIGFGGRTGVNDYYICQNSYGVKWGYKGLFRIRRDSVSAFSYPVDTHLATKYEDLKFNFHAMRI